MSPTRPVVRATVPASFSHRSIASTLGTHVHGMSAWMLPGSGSTGAYINDDRARRDLVELLKHRDREESMVHGSEERADESS